MTEKNSSADRTIDTLTLTLTSLIGCSTGHASRTNYRAQTVVKIMDTTAGTAEGDINCGEKSRTGLGSQKIENKNEVRFEEGTNPTQI